MCRLTCIPYTRGNNDLVSIIPPWAHEGGIDRLIARLKDRTQRDRLKHDIRAGLPGLVQPLHGSRRRLVTHARERPAQPGEPVVRGPDHGQDHRGEIEGADPAPDPLDVLFDFLIEENGSIGTIYAHHTEEDMNLALVQPWCSIGSDGSALAIEGPLRRGHPHPRNFGTFPRVLGEYVRNRKLLRLEEAVRKMTSLNATKVGLFDRGLLRTGLFADVTVFDPNSIIDHSTYLEPFQYNSGIVHVVVNGQVVLEQGRETKARPGRALRHVR